MKLNSPESLKSAGRVFRTYGGSWTAAREAGHRDASGVLVIPVRRGDLGGPLDHESDGRASKDAAALRNGVGK